MKRSVGLHIRLLRYNDIFEAIVIHQAAFPDFFLTFLGPVFLKLLYRFYIQGKTEIALAAEHDGKIVATLLGTTHPQEIGRAHV